MHLNIRSLPKKIDQFRVMLHESKINVLAISETWLKKSLNSALYDIQGFNLLRLDRAFNTGKEVKRGGGLITYFHNKHSVVSESLDDWNV